MIEKDGGRLFNRRHVLAGLGLLAASGLPARAEDAKAASPIAHGLLADNPLAKAFVPARANLPDVTLLGPSGRLALSSLYGRTILMPIWAEWCTPCLNEIPDFALLQREYGNAKFAIIPVLSGPRHTLRPDLIAEIFAKLGASVFQPLMEDHFGDQLLRTMAWQEHELAVPCNVLIAPDGNVVAREIGLEKNPNAKQEGWLSLWGSSAGQAFAAAMAAGFLG